MRNMHSKRHLFSDTRLGPPLATTNETGTAWHHVDSAYEQSPARVMAVPVAAETRAFAAPSLSALASRAFLDSMPTCASMLNLPSDIFAILCTQVIACASASSKSAGCA